MASHGAAEGDTSFELQGHVFRDELGVDLRMLDLQDVHVDLLPGHLAQLLLEAIDLGAFAADDHAGPGGHDRMRQRVAARSTKMRGNAGRLELLLEQLPDLASSASNRRSLSSRHTTWIASLC